MELFYLVSVIYHLNPFVPNVAFLCPNIRKSYRCFLGVEKEWLGNRWVKVFHTSICTDFFPQLRQFLYGLYFCFSLSTPMLFWNGFPVVLLIAFYCFRTILCFRGSDVHSAIVQNWHCHPFSVVFYSIMGSTVTWLLL